MSDGQLWDWVIVAAGRLDPLSQLYVAGQTHNVSLQLLDALLELRLRGTQLVLAPSDEHHPPA